MKLSDERLAEFNDRMNNWISKQGLVFQLTHGGTGLGGNPPIIGSIIRSLLSILILALIAALAYGGYLYWKVSGDKLPEQLQKGIAAGLGAEELQVTATGFERDFNSGSYKKVIAKGNESTFYNHLEARNLKFQMEPLNGLFGDWEALNIDIGEAKISIKAGEADDQRAETSWQSLFFERSHFSFQSLRIKKATLSWGYSSPATWGSIVDSELIAERTPQGWKLKLKGGKFSQGIFRNFAIKEIKAELDKEQGLLIPEASLLAGKGTFTWSGNMTSGGASPNFKFQGSLTKIPVAQFIPRALMKIVNGSFTGSLAAEGSTNNSDGIAFTLQAQPDQATGIYLTKELSLLQILSHLDTKRTYRKVLFNHGSFTIKTKGDSLEFQDIQLSSQEDESGPVLAKLKGNFTARPVSKDELEQESHIFADISKNTSETIGITPELGLDTNDKFQEEIRRFFHHLQYAHPHLEVSYFEKDEKIAKDTLSPNKEKITVGQTYLDLTPRRSSRIPFILDGEVELAVSTNIFETIPQLPNVLPLEEGAQFRWIKIPLTSLVERSTDSVNHMWEKALETEEDSF